MTLTKLVSTLDSNVKRAKILINFDSRYIQIHNAKSDVVYAGLVANLQEDELHQEIIPTIQEEE